MRKVKLGDVLTFQRGYDLTKSQMLEGNIPVIGSSEIIGWHNEAKSSAPNLLIGRSGTVGRPQFYDIDIWPHNTSLFVSDFHGNNPKFAYYFLQNLNLEDYANSSGVPTLNRNFIQPLIVNYPELHTQQKIASLLSALDDKIELNNKINAELEAMAKLIYDYWFVQFDFPDENGKPYRSSGGKIIWNKELKMEIPEEWEVKRLEKIFTFEAGIEPGSSEYLSCPINKHCVKFFRVGDIEEKSSVYVDLSNKIYVTVEERDIVVTFDGSVGKLGFGLNGAFSSGLRKIYDKSKQFDNSLIYFIFKDERIIATIHKYATGSILLHASSSISHLKIPFEKNVYLKFQEAIKSMFDQMVINKQENQKLAELRDWLLPMLMNGQVKIK